MNEELIFRAELYVNGEPLATIEREGICIKETASMPKMFPRVLIAISGIWHLMFPKEKK